MGSADGHDPRRDDAERRRHGLDPLRSGIPAESIRIGGGGGLAATSTVRVGVHGPRSRPRAEDVVAVVVGSFGSRRQAGHGTCGGPRGFRVAGPPSGGVAAPDLCAGPFASNRGSRGAASASGGPRIATASGPVARSGGTGRSAGSAAAASRSSCPTRRGGSTDADPGRGVGGRSERAGAGGDPRSRQAEGGVPASGTASAPLEPSGVGVWRPGLLIIRDRAVGLRQPRRIATRSRPLASDSGGGYALRFAIDPIPCRAPCRSKGSSSDSRSRTADEDPPA